MGPLGHRDPSHLPWRSTHPSRGKSGAWSPQTRGKIPGVPSPSPFSESQAEVPQSRRSGHAHGHNLRKHSPWERR